jgi:hypothetical protein
MNPKGRPPGKPTPVRLDVRLTAAQAVWVAAQCAATGEAASALVRRLVQQAMEVTR